MNTQELLGDLEKSGLELWLDGDQLQVRGPQAVLSVSVLNDLKKHKEQIILHLGRRGAKNGSALSSPQRSLLSIYQADGANVAYNVATAFRLRVPAEQAALNRAFIALQDRHDTLRTTIHQDVSGATAILHEHPLAELEVEQVSNEDEQEILERLIDRRFDLGRGPVCRLVLVRRAAEELLILLCHHIAADSWSMEVLTDELARLYEAARDGRAVDWPIVAKSYRDFTREESEYLASTRALDDRRYWTSALSGDLPVLAIASAGAETRNDGALKGKTSFEPWKDGHFARVTEAARAHDVPPFVYLLSVYYLLLWRYGRATDIVVGVPSTLRTIYGCEQTVGHYVNTLPVRMQIEPTVPFEEWVQRVNRAFLAGMDHQAYPFPEIVRALPRTGARSPVFQAMFNLIRTRAGTASAAKRAFGELIYWTGNGVHGAPCDVMLTVSNSDDSATMAWNCSAPLIEAGLAGPMARSYELLVDQVVRNPTLPLCQLRVWSHTDEDRGPGFASTLPDSSIPGLLHEAVRAQAQRTPMAVAISDGEQQLTYAELDSASDRVAELFVRQGLVGIETTVAVLMSRNVDLAVAFLAVLKAGGVVLPLDTRYPLARITTILSGSRAGFLLHDAANRDVAVQTPVTQVAYESLEAAARDLAPTSIRSLALTPERLAWIIYTSGSTGVPNGVALEHRNFLNLFHHSRQLFQPDDLKVVLASSAICFDVSIYELFLPLTVGGKVVIVENALALPEGLDGVTFINAVASVLDTMLQLGRIPPTVQVITSTGEPLMRPLANRVHALPHVRQLYNHYGPAETCIYSMVSAVTRDAAGRIAIGRPIEGQIHVLDEWGNEVPPGIIGEIYISSRGVSRGYLHGPALTGAKFLPDPFAATAGSRMYRTGDFGRYLPGGEVEYVSRRDSQIKLRGFRIELQEIETALLGQAEIKSAAVKVQSGAAGPYLVAYVVSKSGGQVDPEEMGRKLSAKLPHYMVPQFYLQLSDMPLNPSGKIDRKSLPRHDVASVAKPGDESHRLALGDAQIADVVAGIWKEILDVPEVGPADDFFRLGGHSLSSATVIARVNQAFGLALAPVALFDSSVFSDFVAHVSRSTGFTQNIPAPVGDGVAAAGAVSSMQRGMWLDAQLADGARLASYNVGFAIEMRGDTDVERLEQSLRLLVARHAALRTVFQVVDGRLVSRVRDDVRIDLGVTASPAQSASTDARSFLASPLSPERGPLAAARLLKHDPTHCTLVLKLHHLIADGRTFRILADELMHVHATGSCAGLPELPVSYQSFAVSLDDWLETASADHQRDFWLRTLADAPRLRHLAGTRLEEKKSFSGDEVTFELPSRSTDTLQALARSVGVTPYMLYHSAFALLLARLSGQRDLILGTPYSCRHHQSLEGLAGLFVNMLPLRVRVDDQETFLAFLKRQRKNVLQALANGTFPFESLLQDLRNDQRAQALPLIQCVFAYEHLDEMTHEVTGTTWRRRRIPEHSAKFDLTLQILETSEGLTGALVFRTGSLALEVVEHIRDCWLALLESLAATADTPRVLQEVLLETAPGGFSRAQVDNSHAASQASLAQVVGQEPVSTEVPAGSIVDECEHEVFFKRMLGDIDEPTAPFGLMNVQGGHAFAQAHVALERELAQRIRHCARAAGVSAASVCHLAWAMVVARATGREVVVFGTVLPGIAGAEPGLEMFTNTLPLRVSIDGRGILESVRDTHRLLAELARHRHASPALAQRCSAVPASAPLFSSSLNYRDIPAVKGDPMRALPGAAHAHYPVALSVEDLGDEVCLTARVDASEDPHRVCEYMRRALSELVEALQRQPHTAVRALDVLPDAERHRVLVEWNDTAVFYPHDRCIHELFEDQVEKAPDAVAVVHEGVQLTYRQLNQHGNRLAHYLRERGVGPDSRVAICVERGLEMVIGLLGILKAGGAYVPLDPGYPRDRLEYMLEDAKPRAVLTQRELRGLFPSIAAKVIELDQDWPAIAQHSAENIATRERGQTSSDLAYVIYTSGSTGRPKGVMVEHRQLAHLVHWHCRTFGVSAGQRCSSVAGIGFDAMTWEIMPPLCAGASLSLPSASFARDPDALLRWWQDQPIDVGFLPTPIAELAFGKGMKHPTQRVLLVGGDRLHRCPSEPGSCVVVNNYGPTETTVVATSGSVRSADAVVHIGRPISNTRIYILDGRHQPVPIGVAGEIYVGGAGVARGYLNRPELTAERFLKDPFSQDVSARMYKTGDLGRWRADGNIEFLGRNDDQVKIRGFRIELGEIESQLMRHDGITEAVVTAREEGGEKRLVAYVVCRKDASSEAPRMEALRNHLKAALPEYMVPSAYVYLNQLPLTPNGKLDRKALPAPDDSSLVLKAYEAPRGKIEEALAEIWRESLHVERVGRVDSFFELGGHSILAMQIVAEIEKRFDMKLSISTFFESATIEKLARVVLASGGLPRDQHYLPVLRSDSGSRHEPFPLTEIQQTYLVGRSGLYPLGDIATHGYSEADVYDLDLARFERALNLLFNRHEMLRVVITPDQRQRILPSVPPYRVQFRDLAGNDEATAAAALAGIRNEMTGTLKTGGEWPLFETRVTKLPDGRYRIHSLIDALIADAFSVQILTRDLYQCYDGLEDLLEPIDVSFRDYVLAIEEHKQKQPYAQSKRYWLERINTLPGAPELPVSPQRATRANGEFRVREKRYEPAQWEALKRRAATSGLTPSNLLLSAYAAVIGSWSKSSRFLLNLTLFNRLPLHRHINRVIGDFTSLMLLEIDCRRQDFQSFALDVQQQFWKDLEHRHFSGVDVLREHARGTDHAARSVVPVVFTSAIGGEGLLEDAVGSQRSAGQMHIIDGEGVTLAQTSQVWLDHSATEEYGSLRLNWNSVDALFEPGVLDNMFEAYIALLDEILRDDRPLRHISTHRMPAAQLAARAAINSEEQKFGDILLHQLVAAQVAATPAAPALIAGDLTLRYADLWAASGVLAERLLRAGVRQQDRVAIVMHKGWEQVVASLGIVRVGAAYVPIDRSLPPARRNLLVSSVGARVALVQEGDASDLPGVHALVVTRELLTAQPSMDVSVTQPSDSVAYVIFTSGSTGTPKGVVIDHAGAVNTILDINRRFGVGPTDRTLALSSLSFDLSVYDLFGLLAAGGTLVVPEEEELKNPSRWQALIESRAVTLFNSVPALMQLLVEHLEEHSPALPSCLRLVMLSGDWIPAALPDRIRRLAQGRDVRVVSLGGATEASIWSVFHEVQGETSGLNSIPYGKPLANQSLHVLREDLSACPDWVAGDLYIGGKGLAKGYWGDQEKTARSFIESPFDSGQRLYRTGDKARYMEDGVLEFLGREDTQVKVQGYRIELGEIESRLSTHPGVNQAVACVQKDSRGNARLAAYVVPKADSSLSVERKLTLQIGKPAIRSIATRGISLARSEAVFVLDAPVSAPAKLSDAALGEWLTCVSQFQPHDSVLPRYFYPSAGSLNPVQLYVVVHETLGNELGIGIEPGSYYYHPVKHALYRVAGSAADVGANDPPAHPFTTVLVGEMNAIEPIYKESAEDFCRIEAGYMQGLMASHGAAIGFDGQACGVDAQAWRDRLGLADSQRVLAAAVWRTSFPAAAGAQRELASLSLHGRQSFRKYDGDRAHLGGLESLLRRAIETQHVDAELLPVLVYVKREAGSLHRGFHRVTAHGLVRVGDAVLEAHHFAGFNAPIYEAADVMLFVLSTQGTCRDRDLETAGRLGQFLMSRAADNHIGWCPIGSALFGQVAESLGLPGHWELVHCLTGGVVSDRQLRAFETYQGGDGKTQDLPASLREFLKQQLPAYMLPQQIILLDAMPLGSNGKVARDRLPLASQLVQTAARQLRPARTATEVRLVELWKEILGVADVGIDQTFFELGGNSMLLIRMHSRLRDEFVTDLAMIDLFNYVDVKSLAAWLDDKQQSGNDLGSLRHQAEMRRQALDRLRASTRH